MKIISNYNNKIDEKIVLVSIIGCLEALKEKIISIDEAEKFVFSPCFISCLEEKKCDNSIINLIEKGCELEDIYDLLPNRVNCIIDELKKEAMVILKKYKEYNEVFWIE